jgi:hypothetical protein
VRFQTRRIRRSLIDEELETASIERIGIRRQDIKWSANRPLKRKTSREQKYLEDEEPVYLVRYE